MKRVLVIIVTYNGRQWLERCLGSVPSWADVFVVDNDSTDGTPDEVAARFPSAKLVRSAENLGFSKANNLGFQYALERGYDYVYLMNQDAWLAPGALETLVDAAQAHPAYAVLSPLQYQDGYKALDVQFAKLYRRTAEGVGSQTSSASLRPLPIRSASADAAVGPSLLHGRGWPWVWEPTPSSAEPIEVKRVMAAHWLVPVSALKLIGPFEEEMFPLYGQDDDWCNRARYHALKIGIVPDASAVHDRALRKEEKEKIIGRNYYTGSLVRLCDGNRPLWERMLYVCAFTFVKALKYGSLLPFRHFAVLCRQLPRVRAHRNKAFV